MGLDIESGQEEENHDKPAWLKQIFDKLLAEMREKTRLGVFLSSTLWAVLISLILLLFMFALPRVSSEIMLLLGEKLGVMALWTLVKSYPGAVSVVVAQVYVSVFIVVFMTQHTANTAVRLFHFYRPPPSLGDLLELDIKEFGDSMANIYAEAAIHIEKPGTEPSSAANRVHFFEGEPIVHIYESEYPKPPPRHRH